MASFELNTIGFVQKWLCAKGLVKSIPGVIHTAFPKNQLSSFHWFPMGLVRLKET